MFLREIVVGKKTLLFFYILCPVAMMAATSKTTFVSRSPVVDDLVYDTLLSKYHLDSNPSIYSTNQDYLSIQGIFSKSTNDFGIARYFFPGYKTDLRMTGSAGGDIIARWLLADVSNGDMDSKFRIRPERKVRGLIFNKHFEFDDHVTGLWMEGTVAPLLVTHDLHFEEYDLFHLGNGTNVNTITGAFNQSGLRFGKFNIHPMTKFGFDDFLVKVGWDFLRNRNIADLDKYHADVYGSLVIPLGDRPTAEYVFEPHVGSRHWGLGFGSNFDVRSIRVKHNRSFLAGIHYIYRFRATERRSFDLEKNGQWSRYLSVVREGEANQVLAGINFFTRDMKVYPGSSLNALARLRVDNERYSFELGYNLWYRGSENVELKDRWDSNIEKLGIRDQGANASDFTKSVAKISDVPSVVASDSSFVKITHEDIDLRSAAHDSVLSHKFFSGFGIRGKVFNFPAEFGLGSSYEVAHENTGLNQWSLWLHSQIYFSKVDSLRLNRMMKERRSYEMAVKKRKLKRERKLPQERALQEKKRIREREEEQKRIAKERFEREYQAHREQKEQLKVQRRVIKEREQRERFVLQADRKREKKITQERALQEKKRIQERERKEKRIEKERVDQEKQVQRDVYKEECRIEEERVEREYQAHKEQKEQLKVQRRVIRERGQQEKLTIQTEREREQKIVQERVLQKKKRIRERAKTY